MKRLIVFLAGIFGAALVPAAALAQTVDQHVQTAAAGARSAIASSGVPLWVWIVVALAIVLVLVALARRRRSSQAIIKTRLG